MNSINLWTYDGDVAVVSRAYRMNGSELKRPKINRIEYFLCKFCFSFAMTRTQSFWTTRTNSFVVRPPRTSQRTNGLGLLIIHHRECATFDWTQTPTCSASNSARPKYSSSVCSIRSYSAVKSGYVHRLHRVYVRNIVGISLPQISFALKVVACEPVLSAVNTGHVQPDDNDK